MEWKQLRTAFPVRAGKEQKICHSLRSQWGEKLLHSVEKYEKEQRGMQEMRLLAEYPRPQMVRLKPAGRYEILNGWWRYAIMDSRRVPQEWEGWILVPFSPETELSGVKHQLTPQEYLWYEREIWMDEIPKDQRILLHFGAVDQSCEIFLNGKRMAVHTGGYLPFTVEVTERIRPGRNILHLCVRDVTDESFFTRGKQKLQRGGMFYTAQSGIWQSVWLEWVPVDYIEYVRLTPVYDEDMLDIRIRINGPACSRQTGLCSSEKEVLRLKLYEPVILQEKQSDGACCFCNQGRKVIREITVEMDFVQLDANRRECHAMIQVPEKKSWSPQTPWLYGLCIATDEDKIAVYTAMRCFTVEADEKGIPRLCLNHEPCFMDGVLDQGYWPESLMTPPGDEAMIADIVRMKKMGFNMIRKHCKLEPDRWYFHCDRLGMLVWQDMVNGGTHYNMIKLCYLPTLFPLLFARRKDTGHHNYRRTSRTQKESRRTWYREAQKTVELLYNHPSIAAWVLFNEGWGQFESAQACEKIRKLDESRFLDAASGWFDQKQGDMRSVHNYFRKLKVEKGPRPFVISEYGGYAFPQKGHVWTDRLYGYGSYRKKEKLQKAFEQLHEQILSLVDEGLCAAVYTQLSDIEEEVNGILTYDRRVWKIEPPVREPAAEKSKQKE